MNELEKLIALSKVVAKPWIGKTLHGKANKSEVEKLEEKLQRLREKVFSLLETLATKEDFNKLERKLDKLIEREIDRGRSRR